LHGVAELLLAGPQHRASGTIRLRVIDGGFATVAQPDLRVVGAWLCVGDQPAGRLKKITYWGLATALDLDLGAPDGLYRDGAGVASGDLVEVDEAAAEVIVAAFAAGEQALRVLAPDSTPVLWPEHFDLGITLDEVNYGVSPGDAHLAEPYAYVGPWERRSGPFWNTTFGAALPLAGLTDADVLAFFAEGREHSIS